MYRQIEIRNLASDITEEDVKKLLAVVGRVQAVTIVPLKKSVKAQVTLSVSDEAAEAVRTLDGSRFLGRKINVVPLQAAK